MTDNLVKINLGFENVCGTDIPAKYTEAGEQVMYVSLSTLGNVVIFSILAVIGIACFVLACKMLMSALNSGIYNTKGERVWGVIDAIAIFVGIIACCFVPLTPMKRGFVSVPMLIFLVAVGVIFVSLPFVLDFSFSQNEGHEKLLQKIRPWG